MYFIDEQMFDDLILTVPTLKHFPASKKKRIRKKCNAEGSAWFRRYAVEEPLITGSEANAITAMMFSNFITKGE